MFGDVEVANAGEVLRNWDQIKRDEPGRERGVFADVPETLPATLYARKLLRRAGGAGEEWPPGGAAARARAALEAAAGLPPGEGTEPGAVMDGGRDERFDRVGELLLAAVALARELRVDPELSLRAAADRFRESVEGRR